MKLVLAMLKHETNTFSPIVTDLARFEAWGLYRDQAAIDAYAKTNMPLGVYLKLAREIGADVVLPMAAEAMPGGKVTREAYAALCQPILDAVRAGCDGCLLDLHGAMVCEDTDDGEGTLLEQIRAIAPTLPIAVTLDLHCNLTQRMIDNCDALIGYKTYPHVDMDIVAERVGRILLGWLQGKRPKPVMAWRQLPLLSQTLAQGTADEPMKGLIAACHAAEAKGLPAATVFGGFALADIADAGTSVITVADDFASADAAAAHIAKLAWEQRDIFLYQHRDLQETVAQAKATEADGPIVLLDHADNCGSGGTQDVMSVIAEVLRQGLQDVAVGAVWDPEAVKQMQAAGVGATITLKLGGKTDMPAIHEKAQPLTLNGKVRTITDGEWVVRGPMYTGYTVKMGPTAVFETGGMQIVVVSNHHEPWDTGVFTSVGIDPNAKKYLLLKSRIHYRAGFAPLAKATFTLDGIGVTTSDNTKLDYKHLRKPLYPFDRLNDWP
jgi:microcystin degradation protein MlrC